MTWGQLELYLLVYCMGMDPAREARAKVRAFMDSNSRLDNYEEIQRVVSPHALGSCG